MNLHWMTPILDKWRSIGENPEHVVRSWKSYVVLEKNWWYGICLVQITALFGWSELVSASGHRLQVIANVSRNTWSAGPLLPNDGCNLFVLYRQKLFLQQQKLPSDGNRQTRVFLINLTAEVERSVLQWGSRLLVAVFDSAPSVLISKRRGCNRSTKTWQALTVR